MLSSTFFPFLSLLLLPAAPTASELEAGAAHDRLTFHGAAAQDDEITDRRPAVKELLDELDGHVKEKGARDTEAVGVIDSLLQEFSRSGPRDRTAIAAGIAKCFDARRRDLDDGVPDNRLHLAAAVALGHMGPESVKLLARQVGRKPLADDLVLQRQLILALGRTADPEGVKTLLGCLNHRHATIIAAGSEALGEFRGADQKLRKDLFNELLKILMPAHADTIRDVTDPIARERYDSIAAPIITSLGRLAGQDIRDPEEWQRWWNKNKREDWDQR